MAKTGVADVIVPTEFEKYAIERTAELARFGQCGIVEHSPEFDMLAAGGGSEVKMPFWKDLSATRQLLSDSASLVVNKITADQDVARIHNDAQVWSVNHLAQVMSGDDPMQAIIDLVAAVGLWLAAVWGGVVWLTAASSMAAVEIVFPQIYGGRIWVILLEVAAIAGYLGLSIMAARERPD